MYGRLLISCMLLAAAGAAQAQDHYQRPGQWELTMRIERNGKANANHSVSSKCLTAADIERSEKYLYQPFDAGCASDHRRSGKTIKWTYQCTGKIPMHGSGELTFSDDAYSGHSTSLADLHGGKLKMTQTRIEFSGRRLGDCEKK